MSRYIFLAAIAIQLTGCAHHQLRYQTVKQAHTVADVHTQQVLDNLAKFAHNPNALPHFSWPNAGGAEVNGSLSSSVTPKFTPFRLMDLAFDVGGSRGMKETYTMTPINDPRKLELMRCAYQRAIGTCCTCGESGHCPNCEKRFNKFYLGSENPSQSKQKTYDGHDVYRLYKSQPTSAMDPIEFEEVYEDKDEIKTTIYRSVESGHIISAKTIDTAKKEKRLLNAYVDITLPEHTRRTGTVTAACLYAPCWFEVGKGRKVPSQCCHVGHYCGTYVWVPKCGVDQLTQLTITILDIALNDPPAGRTKEVIAYLDQNGNPVANAKTATFEVKQVIPITASPKSVAPTSMTTNYLHAEKDRVRAVAIEQFERTLAALVNIHQHFDELLKQKPDNVQIKSQRDAVEKAVKSLTSQEQLPFAQMTIDELLSRYRTTQTLAGFYFLPEEARAAWNQTAEQLSDVVTHEENVELAPQLDAERQSYERLPPTRTPVPNAGFLQFQQNLDLLTPR